MAKKVILKDDNVEIMPITRGELILDSSGQLAFHSSQFLATQSLPGLMSGEDKTKLDSLEKVTVEDKKVEQVNTTTNSSYRILFSNSADDTTKTEGARKSAKLLFNPSTGALTATALIGKLNWSNLNNVPENFTPAQHIHNTSEITALTSYSKATSASDLATTDTLNVALGKLEYKADTAYDWILSVTTADTDKYINKWQEILDFLNAVDNSEGADITDEFVTRKTGQTITGEKIFSGTSESLLTIDRNSTSPAWIKFAKNNTLLGYIGIDNSKKVAANIDGTVHYILHSGNSYIQNGVITINGATITPITSHQSLANYVTLNGKQTISGVKTFSTLLKFTVALGTAPFTVTSTTKVSNLNSDMVDGYHISTAGTTKPWSTIVTIGSDGVSEMGRYIDFHYDNTTGSDYSTRLQCGGNHSNTVTLPSATGTLALTSQIPSALKNPKKLTIFGVEYDGSTDKTVTAVTMISTLSEGSSNITDQTEILTSYASDNGFADTNAPNVVYKRDAVKLYNYINAKLAATYAGLNKTGTVTSVAISNGGGIGISGSPITSSGTIIISNAGVRSTTINGNYLRVNTNGTNTDLTIPYATLSSVVGDGTMNMIPQYNNEINFGGTNAAGNIYFGYRAVDSKPIPTNFIFGGADGSASVKASGFIKKGSSDSYVLLGGGGHKALSDFAMASAYVKKAGDTMTGRLTMNTTITDHSSPVLQCLVINSTAVPDGATLTLKNSPGIGFHISNYSWGSLVFNGNFNFINDKATSYMPVKASKFITNGGTSSLFVKGDGSLDSASYATTSSLGNYLPLAGGTMKNSAVITLPASASIVHTTATSSNAVASLIFYKGTLKDSNYNHSAQIGWHNIGDTDGAIYLVPNPLNSNPWEGSVGLYIGKTLFKWNNNTIIHTGNYSTYLDSRYYTETEVNNKLAGYLPLSGGTMTGNIKVYTDGDGRGLKFGTSTLNSLSNQLLWQSAEAIRFGSSSWDWNAWAGLKYNHSSKIIYLGLADGTIFNANYAQSGGKVYFPGVSNLYTGNGTNLIWHAGNDGSGSGLDADTLDGYHEYSFLRLRATTSTNGENTLWSLIGIKSYHNALPDGLSGLYTYGEVVSLAGNGMRLDIFSNHRGSENTVAQGLWWRSGWNNDKKAWRRIIDSGNIASLSVNYATSAGNADTVDNKHASDFATSGHNHDSSYVKYAKVSKSTADSTNAKPYIYNIESETVVSGYYGYWYILNLGLYSGGNFGTLLAMPYQDSLTDSELFIRSAKSGSWRTWRRVLHDGNYSGILDSRYVNTAGDTMTGPLTFANGTWNVVGDDAAIGDYNAAGMLGLKSINNNIPGIGFHNSSNTLLGRLQASGSTLLWNDLTLWHAGNDGAGSGLDADLLDGQHGSYYAAASSLNNYLPLTGGTMKLGEGLQFHADENYFGTNLDARIISLLDGNGTICDGGLIIDERCTSNGTTTITELLRIRDAEFKWKGLNILHSGNYSSYLGYIGTTAVLKSSAAQALTGITNATLSGKLTFTTAAATASISFLNGELIDGYGNVLLGTNSASWNVFNSSRSSLITVLKSGNVGIGTTSPSYKLHVSGQAYSTGYVKASSSDSYVLLGGGGHKALSDFAMASAYVKKAGDTMTGVLSMKNDVNPRILFIPNSGSNTLGAIYLMGGSSTAYSGIKYKFRQWSYTANSLTRLSYYEDYNLPETPAGLTANASYTILTTKNASVSGGGSSWGSSITVKINGTTKTLTIPANPNTWRGITDSYSGTDSTISLSQKGGNALYNALVNGYANSAGNADTLDGYHYNSFAWSSHSHSTLETYFKFVSSDVTEAAVNLSTSTVAHTMTFYRNGISIPYQMDNSNDGGLLRVRGTTESNVIYEMATWDDSGAGETIQFNYYPTTSAATPTYSVSVPKKSGTIALTNDIPSSLPANGGNADTVDGYHYNGLPYIPIAGGSANGTISACTSAATNPGNAAFEAREYLRAGTDTATAPHSMMYAPRIGFHWGNRYWANLVYFDSTFRFVSQEGGSYVNLQAGTIYGSAFYESSDIRLKQNIKHLLTSNNTPQIKQFDWKDSGKHSYGLIAQELESMGYSELVDIKDDGYKTVNYSAALSLIVGKLQVKIKELEKEIEILKKKN